MKKFTPFVASAVAVIFGIIVFTGVITKNTEQLGLVDRGMGLLLGGTFIVLGMLVLFYENGRQENNNP